MLNETKRQWKPPEDPTPQQVNEAAVLIGMLDRMDTQMDPTGWQNPSLEPSELIDRLNLLCYQATIPHSHRMEARRRAQAILDRAKELGDP